MARVTNYFILFCMVVVALSLGVVARLQFGFGLADSLLVSLALAAVFVPIQLHAVRHRHYREMMQRTDDVERQNDLVLDDLRSIERRLSALENEVDQRHGGPDIEPLVGEVEVLGTIIKQVAETMADFEARLGERETAPAEPAPVARTAAREPSPERRTTPPKAGPDPTGTGLEDLVYYDPKLQKQVHDTIAAGKVDLFLQPIVTLPQRKTRYYEALTRLRVHEGDLMAPADFIPLAERSGGMPLLDNLLVLRSVQIVRRLTTRNKQTGIFCNISLLSLANTDFFNDFIEFMEENRSLSSHLIFEFSQTAVRAMGPVEFESLQALVDLGYRLSIDQIEDLRMDLGNLANRGFKFAKIAADRMLSGSMDLGADIHVADLSDLMERNGIELIVDHIEAEAQVLDLLDYRIELAQGHLFSPPRPVRADVFQGFASEPAPQRRTG